MKKNKERFAKLCLQIFDTPSGKELMEYLEDMLNYPVANPNLDSNFAYWREGQNDLIRLLKTPENFNPSNQRGDYE